MADTLKLPAFKLGFDVLVLGTSALRVCGLFLTFELLLIIFPMVGKINFKAVAKWRPRAVRLAGAIYNWSIDLNLAMCS
jgi:hypothetical protein